MAFVIAEGQLGNALVRRPVIGLWTVVGHLAITDLVASAVFAVLRP